MKSRELIDSIFENEGESAAPKGGEQATVSVQITGNPKQIQKALKQLAKDKPAGVQLKSGGETVTADTDVKVDGGKKDDKKAPAAKKDDKKAPPAKKDDKSKGDDDADDADDKKE